MELYQRGANASCSPFSLRLTSLHCPALSYSVTDKLGSGQFGQVSKGEWASPLGPVVVAVKSLRKNAVDEDRVKFLQEAAIMGQFHHLNVVKLYGVVTVGEPVSELQGTYSIT